MVFQSNFALFTHARAQVLALFISHVIYPFSLTCHRCFNCLFFFLMLGTLSGAHCGVSKISCVYYIFVMIPPHQRFNFLCFDVLCIPFSPLVLLPHIPPFSWLYTEFPSILEHPLICMDEWKRCG